MTFAPSFFCQSEGVVVVAATNRIDLIDAALRVCNTPFLCVSYEKGTALRSPFFPTLLFTVHTHTNTEQRAVRLPDLRPAARPPHARGDLEDTREGHPSGRHRQLCRHRRQDGRVLRRRPRCGGKASGAVGDERRRISSASRAPDFAVSYSAPRSPFAPSPVDRCGGRELQTLHTGY